MEVNMSESNLSKDWLKKYGYKLKIVYSYAVVNKLKIKSIEDVLIILQAIEPENANREQAKIYSKMLQLLGDRFRKTVENKLHI